MMGLGLTMDVVEKKALNPEYKGFISKEKYQDFPVEAFYKYAMLKPKYFTTDPMSEFGKLLKESVDMAKIVFGYMNGTEHNDKNIATAESIMKGWEKTINSSISDSDALKNVLSSRKQDTIRERLL